MHELSLALNILEIVEREAGRQGNVSVVGIHLKLGPLSGVVKEALLSAFAMAREESFLKKAELMIEETGVVVYCPQCAAERSVVSVQEICCSTCGTPTPEILQGKELEIIALEIEQ